MLPPYEMAIFLNNFIATFMAFRSPFGQVVNALSESM